MNRVFLKLAQVVLACAVLGVGPSVQAADPTVQFSSDDPEMSAAIANAQRTLDDFLARYESGQLGTKGVAVKVGVPTTEGFCCEHIWMTGLQRDGEVFTGLVANEPVDVNYLKLWQSYQFTRAAISDWNYYDADGKLHGAYTLRVMLPHLPPDQAAQLRAVLAPLP